MVEDLSSVHRCSIYAALQILVRRRRLGIQDTVPNRFQNRIRLFHPSVFPDIVCPVLDLQAQASGQVETPVVSSP